MTLSKSMKALVANDLITKDKGDRDSRSYSLRLTKTGEALAINAIAQVEELDQLYFESLKGERGRFISLLAGLQVP